jgi:hypothetical protein
VGDSYSAPLAEILSAVDTTAHATKIAAEIAQDGDQYRGFAVSVTDENDHELTRVPISPKG